MNNKTTENTVNTETETTSANAVMPLTDRITAFVLSQCFDAKADERAVFGFDGDDTYFYVSDFSDDDYDVIDNVIPCVHIVPIEDFSVKATLLEYSDCKVRYKFDVVN